MHPLNQELVEAKKQLIAFCPGFKDGDILVWRSQEGQIMCQQFVRGKDNKVQLFGHEFIVDLENKLLTPKRY